MANLKPKLANLQPKLADIAKYAKSANYLASCPPIQVAAPASVRHGAETAKPQQDSSPTCPKTSRGKTA